MEDSQNRNTEDKTPVSPGRNQGPNRADAPERACTPSLRPQKKKTSGSHLWRTSNPPSRAPLSMERTTCLQKSHSAQNLASDSPKDIRKRPEQLFLDNDTPRPPFHLSSPSSGSPQSPQSPLPWESPRLKPQHSYMNPTASSMAKNSRSSSLGEGIQMGTPPCSPSFPKGRASSEALEVEPPLLTSSPVSAFPSSVSSSSSSILPCPPSNSPSPAPPPHPIATVSLAPLTQSTPPSRIPLPKQPLSPRRSLCLEVKPSSSSRASTPTTDPGCDVPGNKQALGRHLSLNLDLSLSSPLPVKQRRGSVTESAKDPGQEAEAKECPLVPEQTHTPSAEPQPDHSITLETCRQAVTELHNSLRKTIMLYTSVLQCGRQPSEDQQQVKRILSEALFTVKAELDSLPRPTSQCEEPQVNQGVKGEGEKALALLEQYAELLLKSVERRLDTKT
ncbi:mitogen-activated protein kinase-binding protein 1-like protein [Lates japonicus]|uniref:Mitogen-activated protein kinase-binding protein 1-like protein n=1 Tax=Lates japonicus TaxID=270547 RepID=A0AAD3RKL2_LATJO|nr:mitogen-activated protein kinase-binding protein 1-like protein [Lates japonicus]